MKGTKSSKKKTNGNGGHTVLDGPKRNPYRFSKSIQENEKMVEEMQQQMLELKRKIAEKKIYHGKAISGLKYNMRYSGWIYNGEWSSLADDQYFRREYCRKKLELDKQTFANNACRDKKAIISFSSGKREINIHNLNHRMLHEAKNMDGERGLLKKLNPSKDEDSWVSCKQIEEQMGKLYRWLRWPEDINNTGTMNIEECERKVKDLEWERNQVFVNAPCKASLWSSLPSTKVLRDQIQDLEARDEEKRKMVLVRRKKIESEEKTIKKAEKEIKSMNKMVEMISNRKHRALEAISHEKKLCGI